MQQKCNCISKPVLSIPRDVIYLFYCDSVKVTFFRTNKQEVLDLTNIVKLRQGSGKDRQGMAPKAKGLKA